MLIRVGFSADPDDAFMFWGLASGTVDARGYEFEPVIDDIQSLNELALEGRLEVTAMSAATYPLVQDRYLLPGASDRATYVEFAAVYLETRFFAPSTLANAGLLEGLLTNPSEALLIGGVLLRRTFH